MRWALFLGSLAVALLVGVWALQVPAPRGTETPAVDFSAARAMTDVRAIAARPHPVGSADHARVQQYLFGRMAALGLQSIDWPEGSLRGHTFHYSTWDTTLTPIAQATNPNASPARKGAAEALYSQGSLRASYIHHYFSSNPEAVAAFFSS